MTLTDQPKCTTCSRTWHSICWCSIELWLSICSWQRTGCRCNLGLLRRFRFGFEWKQSLTSSRCLPGKCTFRCLSFCCWRWSTCCWLSPLERDVKEIIHDHSLTNWQRVASNCWPNKAAWFWCVEKIWTFECRFELECSRCQLWIWL